MKDCILCKTQPQQGDLFLCTSCETLIKRAHDIQQVMLAKTEDEVVKTEVLYEPYFMLAKV